MPGVDGLRGHRRHLTPGHRQQRAFDLSLPVESSIEKIIAYYIEDFVGG